MAWSAIVAIICLAVAACHAANTACDSGPCQSGGTCTASGLSSYTCSCPAGYTGANCQFSVCSSWASAISIGFNPNLRGGLDGSERWTFIQKSGFATAGTLLGFKFYSFRVLPLTVGIYRPTAGTCAYTLLALYTPSVEQTGVITYNVPEDQRITVQANDTVGFTWTKLGVVTYNAVTPYEYCEDNQSPPAVGSTITLIDRRYGNRAYSFQAFITPSDSNAIPGPTLGFSPLYRGAWESWQLATMIQTSGFPLAGTLTGFEFYAQVASRPVQLGLYRPVAGCTFTLLKSWTPTITAQGLVTVKFTGSDQVSFNAGDTIGLTWTGFGTVPYDVSSDFNYCDDIVGQPAVGSQITLFGGRYGNRFYSVRPIVQYAVRDACASSPCQNGGFCCSGQSSYYCQCPPGTAQPSCAKATSCVQSPCINGGTCVTVSKTSYTCTCLPGYSGANCETSPCDKSVTQTIGFNPVWRAGLNGEQVWTLVQIMGFPTAGVLTGYNFYSPLPRPIQVGVYRPKGNCKFQLLQSWTHQINNVGQQSIILDKTEQYNFQAGDTIGFSWTNFGVVSFNDVNGYNYCEGNVGQPVVGSTLSLFGGRGYGSRVYSFEAVYMQNGPGVSPAYLGFAIVPRAAEGSLLWTHVQIRGFQTAGSLIGFKFQVTTVRPLQLGLYRPVKGSCAYQLLKGWTPNFNNIGENEVYFTGADQANFQVGDTIGFTWSNYGVVPFDVSSDYNYCEDNVAQPAVGSQITLVAGRYGNRFWSLQAVYKPTVSATACQAPSGCSPNPCLNGATCDADETGYSCTCPQGYSGNNCEVAPAAQPCGSNFNGSQWIGYSAYNRINVDGTLLHTFVQARGFPSAGILTGFQFYASYVRPLSIGLYRWKDGCTFTLLKSWAPRITAVGIQTVQLSSSDQVSFLAGDTIGFTWSQLGVIPFAALPANDYLYCEDTVNPPAVGNDFSLKIGRYGNRFYSIQAFYSPTSIAPQPLALGWNTVLRGGLDGTLVWTFVQLNGFHTDGVLVGFQYYIYIVRPITFGIYRPVGGTCSYILLKTYTPPIVNIGVNKYILSPSEQFQFQAGDTLGLTWTALGAIVYEATIGPQYCEDNQAVTTEGSTITLVANRHSNRVYSAQALYRPISSTGYYVDYCASSPCQSGGSCCSTTSSYQCTCPANTLAPNCAPSDPCQNNPCANGGVCTKISSTAFSCGCKIGFEGDTCGTVVPDPCASSPCKNGGSCNRLDNTNFVCTCTSMYMGSNCQTAVQPCATSPCQNGATCSASGSSYTCACPIGFSGTNCDTVVPDPCASTPCKNGGKCTRVSNTAFSCQCGSNYAGVNCESALPCAASPCKNGGTCTNTPDGQDYDCNCLDDYNDGDTCLIYQDPCIVTNGPPPCRNGGQCNRVNWNSYTCTCPTGWVGQFCELNPEKPPCDNEPCENGGTCNNLDGLSYSCKCPQMWEGPTCNIVHCLTAVEQCTAVPRYGRYAYCDNCPQFVACRAKRQRVRTCSLYPSFSRFIRKCTNDTANACAGL